MEYDDYLNYLSRKRMYIQRQPAAHTGVSSFHTGHNFFDENSLAGGNYDVDGKSPKFNSLFKQKKVE